MIINGIDFDKRCDLEKIELKLKIDRRQREREEQKCRDEFFEMIKWTDKLIIFHLSGECILIGEDGCGRMCTDWYRVEEWYGFYYERQCSFYGGWGLVTYTKSSQNAPDPPCVAP